MKKYYLSSQGEEIKKGDAVMLIGNITQNGVNYEYGHVFQVLSKSYIGGNFVTAIRLQRPTDWFENDNGIWVSVMKVHLSTSTLIKIPPLRVEYNPNLSKVLLFNQN